MPWLLSVRKTSNPWTSSCFSLVTDEKAHDEERTAKFSTAWAESEACKWSLQIMMPWHGRGKLNRAFNISFLCQEKAVRAVPSERVLLRRRSLRCVFPLSFYQTIPREERHDFKKVKKKPNQNVKQQCNLEVSPPAHKSGLLPGKRHKIAAFDN